MRRVLKELAVWVLLGGVTAAGVYLVQQNQALADQNRVLARRAIEPHAGLFVPMYEAATLDNVPVTLGALGHHQLLLFCRTTCPYCRASTPAWNTIAERLQAQPEIAVYGVALDSTRAARTYATERQLRFPVIARPDPRLVSLYRVSSVPLILVVNEQGRLAFARLGVVQSAAAVDSVVKAAEPGPPSPSSSTGQVTAHRPRGRIDPY